jgi:hypothetical protein
MTFMDKFFFGAAMISMIGVVASLLRGFVAMSRGGEKEHRTSNKMMQMRVLFQGAAIIFLFLAYLAKH